MAKMRLFKFWNADGVEKEKEEISLKKETRVNEHLRMNQIDPEESFPHN